MDDLPRRPAANADQGTANFPLQKLATTFAIGIPRVLQTKKNPIRPRAALNWVKSHSKKKRLE